MDVTHSIKCELACESLLRSGSLRLKVNGWSMIPTIWPGDELIIKPTLPDELVPGKIVVFQRGANLVAHRLVGRRRRNSQDEQILTRGDALREVDAPVSTCDLLGEVGLIFRKGRPIKPAQRAGSRLAGRVLSRCHVVTRCAAKIWRISRRVAI